MMERVARVAAELTSAPDAPTYHHLVPQSYIRRWAPDRKGSIRSVRIADGRWKLVGPRKVGGIDDFYRLDADDIDDSRTPPLVIEVLLGELDKLASTCGESPLLSPPGFRVGFV